MAPRHSTPIPPELAQAPMKTVRPRDAGDVYAHPRAEFARLTERGLLHRVANGYYIVVPQDMVGRRWMPGLEAAAAGIATAIYGADAVVVMGPSAARLYGAIPRALATATIAVPRQHREIELSDRPAVLRFVKRDSDRLDAERIETALGPALVTTPEQTVLDLAHRPDLGSVDIDVRSAVVALLARSDRQRISALAVDQPRVASLRRAEDWARRERQRTRFGGSTIRRSHRASRTRPPHFTPPRISQLGWRRPCSLHRGHRTRTYAPAGRAAQRGQRLDRHRRTKSVATALDAALPRALSRSHGRLTLEPLLGSIASTLPATLRTASGLSVRIQLLSSRDRIVWPSERRVLVQRYADAPAAELLVPTLPAFAASKTSTWADRKGARDLWDLWALSVLGAIDRQASDLYRRYGPTNHPPTSRLFTSAPTDAEWQSQLAGQTRITISAEQAVVAVRDAWRAAVASNR